MATVAVKFDG